MLNTPEFKTVEQAVFKFFKEVVKPDPDEKFWYSCEDFMEGLAIIILDNSEIDENLKSQILELLLTFNRHVRSVPDDYWHDLTYLKLYSNWVAVQEHYFDTWEVGE